MPGSTTGSFRWRSSPEPMNSVMGDSGFVSRYGRAPGPHDTEEARIKAHLHHVIRELSASGDNGLEERAALNRARLLGELAAYAEAGAFPRNTETAGRSPVFIDHAGTACAVGHLMTVSGAAELAAKVDSEFHLSYIRDMLVSPLPIAHEVGIWAKANGLSAEELAAIQPGYTPKDQLTLLFVIIFFMVEVVHLVATVIWGVVSVVHPWPCVANKLLGVNGLAALALFPVISLCGKLAQALMRQEHAASAQSICTFSLMAGLWLASCYATWRMIGCAGLPSAAILLLNAGPTVLVWVVSIIGLALVGAATVMENKQGLLHELEELPLDVTRLLPPLP